MSFLTPAPAHEVRKGFVKRTLQFMGLGATGVALFVVAFGAWLACEFYAATPQNVYHRAYQAAPAFLYDPGEMKNWEQWEHKFDADIATDDDAVRHANEMLKSLNDPFTRMHTRDEVKQMKQQSSGTFVGIGIGLGYQADGDDKPVLDATGEPLPKTNANGYPVIDKVFEGGPAGNAGIQVGDAIKSANGVDLKDKKIQDVVAQLKGQPGTSVKLVIQTDGVDRTVDVTRGIIKTPAVVSKTYGDVGYVQLTGFEQDDTVAQMRDALTRLQSSKSLTIDLRGNPGGRVDICISLVSLFLDEGDVVSIRNRVPFGGHSKTTYRLTKTGMTIEELDEDTNKVSTREGKRQPNLAAGKSIVILVNGHSASASEMFTGALQDNHRATVVGEKTFGKGIGQIMLPMPNGTLLRVTTLRYFTPNGTWLGDGSSKHHGIDPDNVVVPGKGFKPLTESDNQLEFALKLLQSK
ncbi:MAG: S41 family peptidase [Candidatus Melainabacteria bacterium]|nr:S41 family peptidase [Candidatus Melainabacteria bacterium]